MAKRKIEERKNKDKEKVTEGHEDGKEEEGLRKGKRRKKDKEGKEKDGQEKEGLRKREKEGLGKGRRRRRKGKEEKEKDDHEIRRARVPPPGQEPPLPKDGCIPVVHMVLHWGPHQALARALMDSGATIPLMSLAWAKPLTIPIAGRKHIKKVEDFAGADVPGAGKYVAKSPFSTVGHR